jgi:hypothetical protein
VKPLTQRVSVQSVEGGGSTFRFEIPRLSNEAERAEPSDGHVATAMKVFQISQEKANE